MIDAPARARRETDVFGHPRGLWFLCFAEGWERFSYYGMQALLVLYMTQQLLLPGHVEHVTAFSAFRSLIDPDHSLSPIALGSAIFGLYAGGVYLTPIFGGLLADQVLGRTWTVVLGASLMALGHFLMAFESSFLVALACLLIGVGCFKGNIASQVGELYPVNDLRRADAFQLYFLGVNIAVIFAPLVCGTLGQNVAWHWGFGAAGIGMLIGLVVYLSGRRWLPVDTRVSRLKANAPAHRPQITSGEWIRLALLITLLPVLALAALGNQQIFNSYLVWGDAHYDLRFEGVRLPVTWLLSIDAIIAASCIAISVAFWRLWARWRREPDEIVKLAVGAVIAASAPLLLALASVNEAVTGHKVSLAWGLGFHVVNDIGYANMFPIGLALFSRAAPKAVGGAMIGIYYLNLFIANLAVGYLGRLLEPLGPASFWLLHAGLVAAGAVLMIVFAAFFRRHFAPITDAEVS